MIGDRFLMLQYNLSDPVNLLPWYVQDKYGHERNGINLSEVPCLSILTTFL